MFETTRGETTVVEAKEGDNLLSLAQAAGLPLEGTCEGQMACSTCHVIVAKEWFAQLPEASEDEDDMLDLAYGVTATSRLSCQIDLTAEMDGLHVNIPADSHDMRGA
ncbi:2Fe-2S iron-sulfur cluster-binding protein [Parerythrobacter jejuensis]|uniref:2Fe-2S iron-sulfur cluster binding domain-containing protein n=1 Tax=Parerythrobacter jejuensis TaxID=795812 RepID=A0A845AQ27_9SPHN|nr:2Fe-2S iron-sulfur cluster-binding protein [Parerythrobacter jejuensis]MXP31724.1 2Fe-2S iron-sulfur cluster binding domain-containing protein [Parerythrobacter jejuensis]